MPALDNAKHERFAQEIAKGATGRDAYRAAGYASKSDAAADASASRLLSDVKVRDRIAELQDRAATSTVTTMESLLEAGWSIITAAKSKEDYSAASQTLERVAKIAGLWVDKTKNDNTVDVRSWLKNLS